MNVIGKHADPALRSLATLLGRSEVATAGGDGGGLDDLFGFAAIGREKPADDDERFYSGSPVGRRWLVWNHAWAHRSVLDRRKEIAPKLLDFEADGDLTIVDRVGDDVLQFADFCEQIRDCGLFPDKGAIGVDPAGIGALLEELDGRGFDTDPESGFVVGIPQGWKLMTAIKTVERKLAGGEIVHGGTRLMSWCVGNAKVEPRGNAILITKQASGFAKIDPLMATFNAAALMALNPDVGGVGEGIIILESA
jgi:phage terminase large subunit-like protein